MIPVGINGFGRIGKAVFIQLLEHPHIRVAAINALDFDIKYMETYLKHDSAHKYSLHQSITIIDADNFQIGSNVVRVFRNRNANELDWKKYGINHVVEATGAYLTTPKCQQHQVDYVVMSAPPKDKTPMFVYNVNDDKYAGEKVISNASCTTNCITPVLKFLNDNYKIQNANFTTIHAATATQTTVDTINSNNRTHRSILNNIIPHSTGASQAIYDVIPSLDGKVYGTSLRVPVSNVSVVDLNVELEEKTSLDEIMTALEKHPFIQVNSLNLVSCDFLTTTYPSIVDKPASMHLGGNRFKLMIWYDNEWSYSAQVVRMLEKVIDFGLQPTLSAARHKCFIGHPDFQLRDKRVMLRVDWNVPTTEDFKITDDYRIASSMPTIRKILADGASRLVIMSHFGRPKGHTDKYSWKHYLAKIQSYFGDDEPVCFLEHGLTQATLDTLAQGTRRVYLLENLRFHKEETDYMAFSEDNEARQVIQKLGDVYVNDAFGCMHRNHLSICGVQTRERAFGYLVNGELEALKILMENKENKKILAICGGAKVHDKLPLLDALSKKMNHIYIAGGNINGIIKDKMDDYIHKISQNKAQIHLMCDGYCATSIGTDPNDRYHYTKETLPQDKFFYDVGDDSLRDLAKLVAECDIIFWNGTLGVVENALYCEGSNALVKLLMDSGKQVIIGGGDTAGFVNKFPHNFEFVSTGGGACIDYISNDSLVGVDFFNR
jgi:glyceraldehyde 3-phosphate dehydrogenase